MGRDDGEGLIGSGQMTSQNGANKTFTAGQGLHTSEDCEKKCINMHWTATGFQPMDYDDDGYHISLIIIMEKT